jgi:hypothetical protein
MMLAVLALMNLPFNFPPAPVWALARPISNCYEDVQREPTLPVPIGMTAEIFSEDLDP